MRQLPRLPLRGLQRPSLRCHTSERAALPWWRHPSIPQRAALTLGWPSHCSEGHPIFDRPASHVRGHLHPWEGLLTFLRAVLSMMWLSDPWQGKLTFERSSHPLEPFSIIERAASPQREPPLPWQGYHTWDITFNFENSSLLQRL